MAEHKPTVRFKLLARRGKTALAEVVCHDLHHLPSQCDCPLGIGRHRFGPITRIPRFDRPFRKFGKVQGFAPQPPILWDEST